MPRPPRPTRPPQPSPSTPRLRYAQWSTLRTRLLWAYEGPILSQGLHVDINDPDHSCWLLRSGSVHLKTPAASLKATPGQWLLLPPGPRRQDFDSTSRILSLRFHATFPGGDPLFRLPSPIHFPSRNFPALERAASRTQRIVAATIGDQNSLLQDALCPLDLYLKLQPAFSHFLHHYASLLQSLGHPTSRLSLNDPRLIETLLTLDRHPLEHPLAEPALARAQRLSVSQLRRLFAAELQTTPRKYLEKRRLEQARHDLHHTKKPLKEIAYALGFKHPSHFTAWFRQHHNTPPQAFRRHR